MKLSKKALDGHMETLLMAALQEGPSYGYQIVQDLNGKAPGVLKTGEGTVYPVLHRLEARGLVRSEWRKGESGRERRYYILTSQGKAALTSNFQEWQALSGVMNLVLGGPGPAPQPAGGNL